MNVTLIATHQISFSNPVSLCNCAGVLQLAACLKQRFIPCGILDLEDFNHLYKRDFNEVMDGITAKITGQAPDVLGLSTMSNNLALALEICERTKKRNPGIMTILGGPGATFCAREILSLFPRVDAVIRGEADKAFPDYIEALITKTKNPTVKGVVYRSDNEIKDKGWPAPINNLDGLPIPAFEHCKTNLNEKKRETRVGDYNGVSVESGRGCPFNCIFCSTSHFFKKKHRLKSVSRLIQEIRYVRGEFGDERIIFNHDIMTLRREYMEELCREVAGRVPGLTWKCHARFDTIDKPLLEKMRRSGCNEIFFGIEAVTPRMQKVLRKQLHLTGFEKKIKWLKDLDFRFSLSYIVGVPGEELRDIEAIMAQTLWVKSLCGDSAFIKIHTLVPNPGSGVYEEWRESLLYDEYGSLGTTDIPVSWTKLRKIIKGHPVIFPMYFHLPIGREKRKRSRKFELLGLAVDSQMKYSMKIAYSELGENMAAAFVDHIDKIQLPPAAGFRDTEYQIAGHSIRELIFHLLEGKDAPGKGNLARQFDAVARFEIALQQVLRYKRSRDFKVIETYYDPLEIIKKIKTVDYDGLTRKRMKLIKVLIKLFQKFGPRQGPAAQRLNATPRAWGRRRQGDFMAGTKLQENRQEEKKRCFIIIWDEKEGKIKCAEVPPGFVKLIEPEPGENVF